MMRAFFFLDLLPAAALPNTADDDHFSLYVGKHNNPRDVSECPVTAVLSRWMRPISTPRAPHATERGMKIIFQPLRSSFLIIASRRAEWIIMSLIYASRRGILTLGQAHRWSIRVFRLG
jgi:hypothetical protein